MPKLRPPGGRSAAAIVRQEPEDETLHEEQENEALVTARGKDNIPEEEIVEDATVALKEQIEALKRSEREAVERADAERKRAEEAFKVAQEREAEMAKLQERTVSSQQEAIDAAIVAAQSEAESAQRDIETSAALGDAKAQAEAYRKLARAESRLQSLEVGKETLEREVKETPKYEPQKREPTQEEIIRSLAIPANVKEYLIKHPNYVFNKKLNAKVQNLHYEIVDDGFDEYSDEYLEEMDARMAASKRPEPRQEELEVEDEPAPRRATVSAPPSREVPSSNGNRDSGRITLTRAQKEAAKIAGVDEKVYAEQLLRLKQEKAQGNYGGGQ